MCDKDSIEYVEKLNIKYVSLQEYERLHLKWMLNPSKKSRHTYIVDRSLK